MPSEFQIISDANDLAAVEDRPVSWLWRREAIENAYFLAFIGSAAVCWLDDYERRLLAVGYQPASRLEPFYVWLARRRRRELDGSQYSHKMRVIYQRNGGLGSTNLG